MVRTMPKHQRSKLEILKTIRDFIELSEKVTISKSVLRDPPWDIDPQTAEEFFSSDSFLSTRISICTIQYN